METTVPALPDLDLFAGIADELAAEAAAWLTDPSRTAHPLVSLPTAALMAQAAGGTSAPAPETLLPGRAWRLLPDRLLALRPHRRVEVTVAQHLHLTAMVLERWGWARSGERIRTRGGRRCILGAQAVVYRLGYGSEHTAWEAGRLLNGALANRGIRQEYPAWNESPRVSYDDALGLIREAIGGAQ